MNNPRLSPSQRTNSRDCIASCEGEVEMAREDVTVAQAGEYRSLESKAPRGPLPLTHTCAFILVQYFGEMY